MQPYMTFSQFRSKHSGVAFPRPYLWRLLPPKDAYHGRITGVYNVQGQAIATNGILVALENEFGTLQFGHYQWFEPDVMEIKERDLNQVRTTKRQQRLEEYV